MNRGLRTLRFATAFAAAFAVNSMLAQPVDPCFDFEPDCSSEVDLLAGQYIDVGTVFIENDENCICVTYVLSEDALEAGWLIYETHLAIGLSLDDIPQTNGNRWGTNPIPGQFPYGTSSHDGLTWWSYCVSLEDLGYEEGDMVYVAAHAVVKIVDEFGEVLRDETAWNDCTRFNEQGNWGMYCVYDPCDDRPEIPFGEQSYIGYEDQQVAESDFDYNDFGMFMVVEELYNDDEELVSIAMEFVAQVNRAGHNHDIHILRTLKGDYTYSILRSDAAYGNEVADVVGAAGSGDFDVVLFDTARPEWPNNDGQVMGQSVIVQIVMDAGNNLNLMSDYGVDGPRFDVVPAFNLYDPYMFNRSNSETFFITSMRASTTPPLPFDGYDVPHILVVPQAGWAHPTEGQTITGPYPDFDDYYSTENPAFAGWFAP